MRIKLKLVRTVDAEPEYLYTTLFSTALWEEKFNKKRIFETVEIPKLSQQEIILVLRKNPKTTLWNKEIIKWDNSDWKKFNLLC